MQKNIEELLKDVTSTRHANVAPAGGSVGGVVHSADAQEPQSAPEGSSSLSVPGDPVTFAPWPGGVPNCAFVARSPLVYFEADGLSRMQCSFPTTQAVVNSMRQQVLTVEDRQLVLAKQGALWADDEIAWHLANIQRLCAPHLEVTVD